jgi:hypothetical protein
MHEVPTEKVEGRLDQPRSLIEAKERDARRAAVERFEESRAGWKGSGMSIEEMLAARHEGHRH